MKAFRYALVGALLGGGAGLVLLHLLLHLGAFGDPQDIVWPEVFLIWNVAFLLSGLTIGAVGGLIVEWRSISRREPTGPAK